MVRNTFRNMKRTILLQLFLLRVWTASSRLMIDNCIGPKYTAMCTTNHTMQGLARSWMCRGRFGVIALSCTRVTRNHTKHTVDACCDVAVNDRINVTTYEKVVCSVSCSNCDSKEAPSKLNEDWQWQCEWGFVRFLIYARHRMALYAICNTTATSSHNDACLPSVSKPTTGDRPDATIKPISSLHQQNECKVESTEICNRSWTSECLQSRDTNASWTCKGRTGKISLTCKFRGGNTTMNIAKLCCDVSITKGNNTPQTTTASCLVNVSKCREDTSLYRLTGDWNCNWERSHLQIKTIQNWPWIMGIRSVCNKSANNADLQACIETKSLNIGVGEIKGATDNKTAKFFVRTLSRDMEEIVADKNCTSLSIQKILGKIEDKVRPVLHRILATNATGNWNFSSEVMDLSAVVTADSQKKLTVPDWTGRSEPSGMINLPPGAIPLEHGTSNNKGRLVVVTVVLKFGAACKSIPLVGTASVRNQTSSTQVASPVISVQAMTEEGTLHKLKKNATLKFKLKKRMLSMKCVFLNRSALPEKAWSSSGMTSVTEPDGNYTVCETDHLTSFAVLITYESGRTEYSSADMFALDLITKIGCGIALFCLIASIFTFACVRSLHALRYRIHLNLCVALAIAMLVFITGVEATKIKGICIAIAIMLHYFFTAAFTWMCVEAIHLFFKIVSVFNVQVTRMRYYMVLGWGVPAVIVGISAAVYHEGYSTPELCWLTSQHDFIWAFIAPVVIIITINAVVLVCIVFVRASLKENPLTPGDDKKFIGALKTVVVLFPIMGLAWVFGFMGVTTRSLPFLYVFAALSSLQGVFILVFHCIGNKEVRGSIKAIKERHSMKSSIKHEMENRLRESRIAHGNGNCANGSKKNSRRNLTKLSVFRKSTKEPYKATRV